MEIRFGIYAEKLLKINCLPMYVDLNEDANIGCL